MEDIFYCYYMVEPIGFCDAGIIFRTKDLSIRGKPGRDKGGGQIKNRGWPSPLIRSRKEGKKGHRLVINVPKQACLCTQARVLSLGYDLASLENPFYLKKKKTSRKTQRGRQSLYIYCERHNADRRTLIPLVDLPYRDRQARKKDVTDFMSFLFF